jgi:multiple sugar transport system substrate-binding protein
MSKRLYPLGVTGLSVILTLAGGCGPPAGPTAPATTGPAGSRVAVGYADGRAEAEYRPRVTAWANRVSATVVAADLAAADVLIVPAADLGGLAENGGLLPVSELVSGEASGYQWNGLLRVYQTILAQWGATEYAAPLTGEGWVAVYRADLLKEPGFVKEFNEQHRRPPLPVRTWEDLAAVAAARAKFTGRPSLPPLPADPDAVLTALCQVAACYDRSPAADRGGVEDFRRGRSFLTAADTGRPRIDTPGFVEAFRWFAGTSRVRPAEPGDPIDALVSGSAVAAVVPVADLLRLPVDPKTGAIDARFELAGVPGSQSYFEPAGEKRTVGSANLVPYFAGTGLVGVVRKTAPHPDACWRLLAELGGPTGSTLAIGPPLGGGPLRSAHVTDDSRVWGQYRLDPPGTASLREAMRQFTAGGVNPAIGLRTPDRKAIAEVIAKQVRLAATGKADATAAMKQATADWAELDAKVPEATRKAWRKKTAGVE